jgi:anaerobic selenocysteine-containing dehydrogenase
MSSPIRAGIYARFFRSGYCAQSKERAAIRAVFNALSVHLGTKLKLNRSHLLVAKETYILPVIGRTELDMQNGVHQSITVEDSMSMVHASAGRLAPASEFLRSEPAIIAGIAKATLPNSNVNWMELIADYDRIRDLIEKTIGGFENYNARIRVPGGFRMPLPPTERVFPTSTGKAMFSVYHGVKEDAHVDGDHILRLMTLRSHDQYNTTIYALDAPITRKQTFWCLSTV